MYIHFLALTRICSGLFFPQFRFQWEGAAIWRPKSDDDGDRGDGETRDNLGCEWAASEQIERGGGGGGAIHVSDM